VTSVLAHLVKIWTAAASVGWDKLALASAGPPDHKNGGPALASSLVPPYMTNSTLRYYLILSALAAALLLFTAQSEAAAPSWMALPDETVVMVRVPDAKTFLEALRSQTKLGAVLLSAERLDRLVRLVSEQLPKEWQTVNEALGSAELKFDDCQAIFRGELGAALSFEPRGEGSPLFLALGWLEPGEELAPRFVAALRAWLAEKADTPHGPQRKDIELAGQDVMHIEWPLMGIAMPELPDDDGDADNSPEAIQQRVEKFKQRLKEAREVELDRLHVFVARLGGRLVWACTVPQSSDEVRKKSDAEREAIDWDTLTGAEEATAAFGRFLAAHENAVQGPPLVHANGLEASLPAGIRLIEAVADPRPLLSLADKSPDPRAKQLLDALGAKGIGPISLHATLDGTTLRTGGLLSLPRPRSGLLELIDQPPLEPEPPAWVPASAVGYQQLGVDLHSVYERLKALFVEMSGEAGRQNFDQLEGLAKTFLQVDLNNLLASLDERISVVTFTPRLVEVPQDNDGADDADARQPQLVQRIGIVCPVADEQVWQKLLDVGSRFVQGGAGGGLKAVEEQGFRGYRIDRATNPVGVFVGNGYLVLGVGPEVSESLLSVLRNPPEGAAAMRTSGLVERGRALISPQPCLIYELEDAGASAKVTRQAIESLLNNSLEIRLGTSGMGGAAALYASASADGPNNQLLEKIKSLLPSDDELEGLLGVSVSQTVATDDGLLMQSALELPSP
jgi:hypothetical protein